MRLPTQLLALVITGCANHGVINELTIAGCQTKIYRERQATGEIKVECRKLGDL